MTSLYRSIITKAWEITKRYKFLWAFGFFAAFLGNAAEFKSLFKQLDNIRNNPDVYFNFSYYLTFWTKIIEGLQQVPFINMLALILLLLFVVVVVIVLIWLVIISQTAIIRTADKIDSNKKVSFKNSFINSIKYFWPVFGLNLFAKFIIFLLLSLFITPLLVILIAQGAKISALLTLLTIVIFVPIAVIIGFVAKYAINYAVLKKQKFWDAISKGWKLFTHNWLISIEMALIILIINGALAFLLALLSIVIVSPFILIGLTSSLPEMLHLLMGGSLGMVAIIFFFAAAVFATWQNTAWTLLFIKLEKGGAFPKIVRWIASKIAKKENK